MYMQKWPKIAVAYSSPLLHSNFEFPPPGFVEITKHFFRQDAKGVTKKFPWKVPKRLTWLAGGWWELCSKMNHTSLIKLFGKKRLEQVIADNTNLCASGLFGERTRFCTNISLCMNRCSYWNRTFKKWSWRLRTGLCLLRLFQNKSVWKNAEQKKHLMLKWWNLFISPEVLAIES